MPVRRTTLAILALLTCLASLPLPALASSDAPSSGSGVVMGGIYSDQWEAETDLERLAAASGKPVSLVGTFHLLRESEDGWPGTTDWLLEQAWAAEATPVANVNVTVPAAVLASGAHDAEIEAWAGRVKGWLERGGDRSLLIAPMQEMNGFWVPYGLDPVGFRAAYRRFVEIFRRMGMDETQVRWVFAPNSWSTPPYRIADYYPGHDVVDLLGISAYNFGSEVDRWLGVQESVATGLAELEEIAPRKPYLLTQVGSSTAGGDRDAWLQELFHLATQHPNVVGLVYFNFVKETDWKLWDGAVLAEGWRVGMQMPTTVHRWPLSTWFEPGPMPFAPFHGSFWDDDALQAQPDIEWLVERGITRGCGEEEFCPDEPVTRGQLATFLVRALSLSASDRDRFFDDDGSSHQEDINALAEAGISQGCGPGRFCPEDLVTREELARLLVRALDLPPVRVHRFTDPGATVFEGDIGALVAAGITRGCAADRFCPRDEVSRGQMAAFLRRSLEGGLAEVGSTAPPPGWRWGRVRPV